jgi:hypothetical protein
LRWITLGVGLFLILLSGLNIMCFLKYKKKEESEGQVASNDIVREVLYD